MHGQKAADCVIHDTFKITGRGLVFVIKITDGNIHVGDWIEFIADGQTFLRKISGLDMGRKTSTDLTALLIKCESEEEIDHLRNWRPENTPAVVWSASTSAEQ